MNERVSCLIDSRWLDGLRGNCGRRLRRPCRSHVACYVNVWWTGTAWIEIIISSQRIEKVVPITDGDRWWLRGLQERVAPRLEHLPKRAIGVLFVAHQVCCRHLEWEGLQLDFSLVALINASGPDFPLPGLQAIWRGREASVKSGPSRTSLQKLAVASRYSRYQSMQCRTVC